MDLIGDENSEIYIHLLTIQEVFVYKIPPLKTASGHRAEDWNLASPLFTGCLKLSQCNHKLLLNIYSFKDIKKTSIIDDNIQIFGQCPIEVNPGENILNFVDGVIDSSRYYVIRIKDPNSIRTTLLGIGFRDREPAFDLKNCLNDYVKYITRMNQASQLAASEFNDNEKHESYFVNEEDVNFDCNQNSSGYNLTTTNNNESNSTLKHYSHINPLKEGEKIKIKISKHNVGKSTEKTSNILNTGLHSGSTSFLRPPPPPGTTIHFQGIENNLNTIQLSDMNNVNIMSVNSSKVKEGDDEDDEWSDFTRC